MILKISFTDKYKIIKILILTLIKLLFKRIFPFELILKTKFLSKYDERK